MLEGTTIRCSSCAGALPKSILSAKEFTPLQRATGSALRKTRCPHCGVAIYVRIVGRDIVMAASLDLLDAPDATPQRGGLWTPNGVVRES